MTRALEVDRRLLDPEFGATEVQRKYVEAVNLHGGASAAARVLGVNKTCIARSIAALEAKAASKGYAPRHDMTHTVPDGFKVKGTSTYYGRDGDKRGQWVKTEVDRERIVALVRAAVEALQEEIPRLPPLPAPAHTNVRLANLYVITDYHLGMMAWRMEGGADWDLRIAEATLMGVFERLLAQSPDAAVGVLAQLGDFLHADGLLPITPTSGHVLDADGRFSKVVQIAVKCLRRIVDMMLLKHDTVHVILAEGNHDIASSVWLRVMFAALYESEPRVTVNASELPFYAYRHGKTMLAFHHGHTKKKEGLPLLFASQFAEMWGATTYRVCHTGHEHHEDLKEHAGMRVHQHPTLAARDAHASRHGWIAERQAPCLTYDDRGRLVGQVIVTPDMLED